MTRQTKNVSRSRYRHQAKSPMVLLPTEEEMGTLRASLHEESRPGTEGGDTQPGSTQPPY